MSANKESAIMVQTLTILRIFFLFSGVILQVDPTQIEKRGSDIGKFYLNQYFE